MSKVSASLVLALAVGLGGLGIACEKAAPASNPNQAPPGLPPPSPQALANSHGGGAGADPHGGMALGGAADPHGGMAMGGGGGGIDPNQRMPAVDEDPSKFLEGVIEIGPKLKDKVKAGDVIFLMVKTVGADGQPIRMPLAVDRLDAKAFPAPFRLTAANTMMAGTKFEGDVFIIARVDRDGEARTREPGDVEGQIKVTIPAKGLKLVLDTPVAH